MQPAPTLTVSRPSDLEIVITRLFAAAPERLFAALTEPEWLTRWSAPPGWYYLICQIDLRPGGRWRSVFRRPEGAEFGMGGVYHEVTPPLRLVNTEAYDTDGAFWGELLVTTELTDLAGQTLLTVTVRHPSQAVRDANSAMELGMAEAYARLAQLLANPD